MKFVIITLEDFENIDNLPVKMVILPALQSFTLQNYKIYKNIMQKNIFLDLFCFILHYQNSALLLHQFLNTNLQHFDLDQKDNKFALAKIKNPKCLKKNSNSIR